MKKPVRYLTADQLLAIHEHVAKYGACAIGGGHRGVDGASAAVSAVRNSYYRSTWEMAAAYAVYIVEGHLFLDGNKRTGCLATMEFLRINDLRCKSAPQRLAGLMIDLQQRAARGVPTSELVRWLSEQLRGRR